MEDFVWNVLSVTAKRGYFGASREDYFSEIKGVRYRELESAIIELERAGYVSIEWTGPNKFVVNITEDGNEAVKEEYKRRLAEYEKKIKEQERAVQSEKVFECGNCGGKVPADAKVCPHCGAIFSD